MSEQRDITIRRMKDAYNKAEQTSERWEDHFGAALDVVLADAGEAERERMKGVLRDIHRLLAKALAKHEAGYGFDFGAAERANSLAASAGENAMTPSLKDAHAVTQGL